jgi:periplasmic protein TonB
MSRPCWEETVFEHRNKAYGAFRLRYDYPFHVTLSALVVILFFLGGMIGLSISDGKKEQVVAIRKTRVIDYSELSPPPPIEKIVVPPKEVVVQKAKVEKYVAPVVTKEEVVEPEEMITMEEVKLITFSENDTESAEGETVVTAEPVEVIPPGSRSPEFPGGEEALMTWLKDHLEYPAVARRMGIEGKVVVTFTVDENGEISDAVVKESLHRLCDTEAIRLVTSMPAWTPGERNGAKTRLKYTLSVPFVLS